MDGYGPATYGDGFADVYDDWYDDVSPPSETAAFVARRVQGPLVELGSGTGRLASPIRATGTGAIGVDASEAMLRRSQARDGALPVVVADMVRPPLRDGGAGGVLLAFNTLFNLPTAAQQVRALAAAAAAVAPSGAVIVEAFVPASSTRTGVEDRVDVSRLTVDAVVLRVSRTDHDAGTVHGHHVELRDGAPVRLRPWQLCFTDPGGLDELARAAGLVLEERFADWAETSFDDASATHVSVYRPAEQPPIVSGQ